MSDAELADVVRRLAEALSPRAVYLFGSRLYGSPRRESDIDIMVLLDAGRVTIEHHQQGYESLRGLGMPVELHFLTVSRFNRYGDVFGSFENDVRRKGKLLYAAQA